MRTETLSALKINKLSQEQYDRELANGNIDENAIYLTPDTELDLAEVEQTLKEQGNEIEVVKGDLTSHTNSSNAQFALVREEFANADTETLKSAKEYSDANKNSAVGEAKAYTNQEIEKLVTDTEFEGVLSTIQDIQNAMATDEELAQALETANGKKVDKGAKGSATQPIYFDDNGAQPIAYTIEKSVPADAKFTDTTYTLIKDATNKKIQLMNGETLVSEVDDNNTTYTIDGSLSTSSTNPIQNKVVAENINNLQEDIDANASEIEEINSKDLFETKHEEGNAIAVSDSAEAPFVGMKLYGKTTQATTSGKNLIDCSIPTTSTTSVFCPVTVSEGNYILSMYNSNGTTTGIVTNSTYSAILMDADKNVVVKDLQKGAFVSQENATKITQIKVNFDKTGYTGNSTIVYGQLESGLVATPYEQYTGGIPSPNPQFPQELKSVGDSGSYSVDILTSNLITPTDYRPDLTVTEYDGKQCMVHTTGSTQKRTPIPFKPNTQYTVKFDCKSVKALDGAPNADYPFAFFYSDGTNSKINSTSDSTWRTITFTSQAGKTVIGVGHIVHDYRINNYIDINSFVFVEGASITKVEPYTKQSITLTDTLRGVGDIADEIDFVRGVKIQRMNEVTLDGSNDESWSIYAHREDGTTRFDVGLFDVGGSSSLYDCLCSDFKVAEQVNAGDDVCWFNNVPFFAFRIQTSRVSTVADLKAMLQAKPIKVIYPLQTPIETPLTEQELNAYRQLHTNKPNTTILSEAEMLVDYVVDSTSAEYIENRLEEVEDKIPTKTSQLTNDSGFINQTGLNNALEDKLSFDEEVINSTSDVTKIVPEGSGKYAAVNKVGGMSYKSRNRLEITATTQTLHGVTFTIDKAKGSIAISGTATGLATLHFNRDALNNLTKGKTYNLINCALEIKKADGTNAYSTTSFVYDDTVVSISPYIQVASDTTVNRTDCPMILEADETDTTFEPYYSGIRNAYVYEVKSVGKNLLKAKLQAQSVDYGALVSFNDGVINIPKNTPVVISVEVEAASATRIYWSNASGLIPTIKYADIPAGRVRITYSYVTTTDLSVTAANILIKAPINDGVLITPISAQLEIGTEATEYEPYKEDTFTIPTGARGVGYGMGINEDCYNYIDFERKVFVKNCAKIILNGSEDWTANGVKQGYGFTWNNVGGDMTGSIPSTVVCDKLKAIGQGYLYEGVENYIVATNGKYSKIYIRIDETITTVELLKQWLAANPVELVYPLATPEEIDLSDILPEDNFIEVAAGGVITAVNEYNYNVPTEISFFTSENPEKVIVADKIVGDLVNEVEVAKTLNGQYIQNYYHIPADIITNYGLLDIYQTTNYYNQSKVYIGVPIAIFDVDEDGNISATPLFKNAKISSELVKNWYTYIMNNGSYDLIDNDIPIFPIVGGSLIFNNNMGLSGKGEWQSSFCTLSDAFNMFSNNLEISCNIISDSCLYLSQNADQPTVVFGGYAVFNTDDTEGTLEETLNSFLALGAVRGIDFSIPVKDITITPVEFDASILG